MENPGEVGLVVLLFGIVLPVEVMWHVESQIGGILAMLVMGVLMHG